MIVTPMPKTPRPYVSRFSVFLPQGLLADLDAMIRSKGLKHGKLTVSSTGKDLV